MAGLPENVLRVLQEQQNRPKTGGAPRKVAARQADRIKKLEQVYGARPATAKSRPSTATKVVRRGRIDEQPKDKPKATPRSSVSSAQVPEENIELVEALVRQKQTQTSDSADAASYL